MKQHLKVIEITENKDGSATLVLDTTEYGRQALMEAGATKMLEDFIKANNDKLPLWTKLKLWWKTK
jgi:hypothetical protein